MNHQTSHIPVLLTEVMDCLDPGKGESYLDMTAGYGGHAEAVLEKTGAPNKAVLVDRDSEAIKSLSQKFKSARIIHKDFLSAAEELIGNSEQFDLILADLGVSSVHLDNASRGFSINQDGPLDMRMDQRQTLTAEEVVNTYSRAELAKIIKTYGDEPKSYRIAGLIVDNRPISTTHELAKIVAKAWPGHSKVHPATRTFQALRIAVNSELELLEKALPLWAQLLNPGGRIAIITFHSIEDRIVKQMFKDYAGDRYDAELKLLTKHPVMASDAETVFNPRARSAKLRAAVKIKT